MFLFCAHSLDLDLGGARGDARSLLLGRSAAQRLTALCPLVDRAAWGRNAELGHPPLAPREGARISAVVLVLGTAVGGWVNAGKERLCEQ